jgi:hypothetical protein
VKLQVYVTPYTPLPKNTLKNIPFPKDFSIILSSKVKNP